MAVPLPAGSVVKVHLMALRCVEGTWYEVSPLSNVYVVEPAAAVLGELKVGAYKSESVTVRVRLDEAAQKSLEFLRTAEKVALFRCQESESTAAAQRQ